MNASCFVIMHIMRGLRDIPLCSSRHRVLALGWCKAAILNLKQKHSKTCKHTLLWIYLAEYQHYIHDTDISVKNTCKDKNCYKSNVGQLWDSTLLIVAFLFYCSCKSWPLITVLLNKNVVLILIVFLFSISQLFADILLNVLHQVQTGTQVKQLLIQNCQFKHQSHKKAPWVNWNSPDYFARWMLALCAKLYFRYSHQCRQNYNTVDFYFVLVFCPDFRFSFVDDNSKCFRHFRHRFRGRKTLVSMGSNVDSWINEMLMTDGFVVDMMRSDIFGKVCLAVCTCLIVCICL